MLAAPTAAVAMVVLHGTVSLGPTQPVCQAGTPCTKPAAHKLLEFTQTNRIRSAWTDAKGHYSVRLEPGTWTIRSNAGFKVTPERFIVRRGLTTQLRNFLVDTGIR